MRRYLRKPKEIKVRPFVARLHEMNRLLLEFPPTKPGDDVTNLAEEELTEILEFGNPRVLAEQDDGAGYHSRKFEPQGSDGLLRKV